MEERFTGFRKIGSLGCMMEKIEIEEIVEK